MTNDDYLNWLWELCADEVWAQLYDHAILCANENRPTLYSSRIDGALLPFDGYGDD